MLRQWSRTKTSGASKTIYDAAELLCYIYAPVFFWSFANAWRCAVLGREFDRHSWRLIRPWLCPEIRIALACEDFVLLGDLLFTKTLNSKGYCLKRKVQRKKPKKSRLSTKTWSFLQIVSKLGRFDGFSCTHARYNSAYSGSMLSGMRGRSPLKRNTVLVAGHRM